MVAAIAPLMQQPAKAFVTDILTSFTVATGWGGGWGGVSLY